MAYYVSGAYYAFLAESPAVNGGNNTYCPSIDQRGKPRPQGQCDIGAIERQPSNDEPVTMLLLNDLTRHTRPGIPFANAFRIFLYDNNGDGVANYPVTFSVPSSGASGTFADSGTHSTVINTDGDGFVAASLTGNLVTGSYSLTVTAGSVTPGVFSLTNAVYYVAPSINPSASDTNACFLVSAPCLTINGALGKALSGDYIYVSSGNYNSTGNPLVNIEKNIHISGGWNPDYTIQDGQSILDGQNVNQNIYVHSGLNAAIDRMIITNGKSARGAGIYNQGSLTLNNVALVENHSVDFGGAIYQESGQLLITNTTISSNFAGQQGGGIYVQDGSATINNVTIHQNFVTNMGTSAIGGGISNPFQKPVHIKNTILAGNGGEIGPDCLGTITSDGYNLIGLDSGCIIASNTGDLIGSGSPINALLGNLADNGSGTLTHALLTGSPAIDAGNPASCDIKDQRGVSRPQGGNCDIGAFEGSVNGTSIPIIKTYSAYDQPILPGTLLCTFNNPNCTNGNDAHTDKAHSYTIAVYQFYLSKHHRVGIDNNNMQIVSTVHFGANYDNSFWTGAQMVYGDQSDYPLADDVIAHEFTHGVTQYESNLFYFYQSGAINESFSDLWGEYYRSNEWTWN